MRGFRSHNAENVTAREQRQSHMVNRVIAASMPYATHEKRKRPGRWFVYALVDQRSRNKKVFYIGITRDWEGRKASHLDNPCVLALMDVRPTMECIRVVDCEETAKRTERHLIRKLPGLVNRGARPKASESANT